MLNLSDLSFFSVIMKKRFLVTEKHKSSRHVYFAILTLLVSLTTSINLIAQTTTSEYQVKAAFLYKFVGYIEWPADSFNDDASPVVFGVLDADLLADNLEQIVEGRRIQDRNILVRRLRDGDSFAGLHVLFVGQSSTADMEPVLLEAAGMSVLTVTETPAPRSSTSVINFEIIDNKVRFDISLKLAERGGLKISSRLLQVAYRVIEG